MFQAGRAYGDQHCRLNAWYPTRDETLMKSLKPTDDEIARLAHRELDDYSHGKSRPIAAGKLGNALIIAFCLAVSPFAQLARFSQRLLYGPKR